MTVWKQIPSFPDYAVSENGEVRRIKPDRYGRPLRILKQHAGKNGRLRVPLSINGREKIVASYRLVCEAFHGPQPTPAHQVAHNDGDVANNHYTNLRWATAKENAADKYIHGTVEMGDRHWTRRKPDKVKRGSENGSSKLTEEQALSVLSDPRPSKVLAAELGVSDVLIYGIRRGAFWKHLPRP
jgi:hypothetical protein